MQITRISQNYNQQNKTNFKGEAERKLFIKSFKIRELKNALEESIDSGFSSEPVAKYFTKVFRKLEKHFAQTKTFKKLDINRFCFKNGKEKIQISLNTKDKPYVTYIEGKPFSKDLNQTNSIFYYGEINNHDPHILRQRFIGTAIKKRLDVHLTGVEEKLKRDSKSYQFVNHARGELKKDLGTLT